MKCEYAKLFLHELADNQLTPEQSTPLQNHLDHCQCCQVQFNEIRDLKNRLHTLQLADNIPDAFIDNAIAYAEFHNESIAQRAVKKSRLQYFAIAASFFIAITLGAIIFQPAQQNSPVIITKQQINLLFDAPKSLTNVTFTVTLPDNVEMQGYPGSKQISWHGNIQQGKNLLSIPISGNNKLHGVIKTQLQHQNSIREFKINIESGNNNRQLI
ncbi:MAG: hypothetical protein R3240_07700 [Gammaproteobacteria bacterium]|nr:hypothetical protein [Gammaproteobacteria bacterium]